MINTKVVITFLFLFFFSIIMGISIKITFDTRKILKKTESKFNNLIVDQEFHHLELSYCGTTLPSKFIDFLYAKDEFIVSSSNSKYTLFIFFSEISCNLCLDRQLAYLSKIKSNSQLTVVGFVMDSNLGFARRFRRVKKLAFSLHPIPRTLYTMISPKAEGPLLMLIDNHTQQILITHKPHPDHLGRSDIFKDIFLRFAGIMQ